MNATPLIQEFYNTLRATLDAAKRNWQRIVNLVAISTGILVICQSWFTYHQRHLVLFVGPAGSSTSVIGPRVVEELQKLRDPSGVNYLVELEQVPEGVSIRERMAVETSRIPLGIIEDSPSMKGNERIEFRALLPMEWDYLFVIFSRSKLAEISKTGVNLEKLNLGDVADSVSKGKLFLGPKSSSSHEIAKFALKKYGDPKPDQHAIGFTDWEQMRTAFMTDQLELAFYSGPLGTELIDSLATDDSVVLLGLGDNTTAIQYEHGFQVYAAKLPENLGDIRLSSLKAEKLNSDGAANDASRVPFCGKELSTLASRRVLACPSTLSTSDGFLVAQAAKSAFENEGYHVSLNADDLPFGSGLPRALPMRMRIHPALELVRQGRSPAVWRDWSTWSPWIQAAVLGLIGLIAIDLLRWLTRWEGVSTPASIESLSPTLAARSEEYLRFEGILNSYESAIDEKTYEETAKERAVWDDRLRDIRKSIRSSKVLSESEREMLRKHYEALKADVESSMTWIPRTQAKRREAQRVVSQPIESAESDATAGG